VARPGEQISNEAAGFEIRFRKTAADTDGDRLEMEATYAPHSTEPAEHLHPRQEERFEIVEGRMRARIGGHERHYGKGDELVIPPGTAHAMWNDGEQEARTLWQVRPALNTERFFEDLGRLAAEGRLDENGTPGPLTGAALMRRYRDEIRVTEIPPTLQAILFPPLSAAARVLGRAP
jgi:mannose-6-phosphate isomerase-like protein (cupin superfamily)